MSLAAPEGAPLPHLDPSWDGVVPQTIRMTGKAFWCCGNTQNLLCDLESVPAPLWAHVNQCLGGETQPIKQNEEPCLAVWKGGFWTWLQLHGPQFPHPYKGRPSLDCPYPPPPHQQVQSPSPTSPSVPGVVSRPLVPLLLHPSSDPPRLLSRPLRQPHADRLEHSSIPRSTTSWGSPWPARPWLGSWPWHLRPHQPGSSSSIVSDPAFAACSLLHHVPQTTPTLASWAWGPWRLFPGWPAGASETSHLPYQTRGPLGG